MDVVDGKQTLIKWSSTLRGGDRLIRLSEFKFFVGLVIH